MSRPPNRRGSGVRFALALAALGVGMFAMVLAAAPVARTAEPGTVAPRLVALASPSTVQVGIRTSPVGGEAPVTIDFSGVASGGTGNYTLYAWNFGDGGEGIGVQVNYTFVHAGNFPVTLTVIDTAGAAGTANITVTIRGSSAVFGGFTGAPMVGATLSLGLLAGAVAGAVAWRARPFRLGTEEATTALDTIPPADPVSGEPSAVDGALGSPRESEGDAVVPDVPEPTPDAVRLSHRLLYHLLRQPPTGPHEVVPPGRTQADMVAGLGASQSAISEILARLAAAGVVAFRTRHVQGRSRRVKVYELTSYGEKLAREIAPTSRGYALRAELLPTDLPKVGSEATPSANEARLRAGTGSGEP